MTILAYDTQENKYVNLRASDCEFGYRTSRFKHKEKDRFFIVSVTFSLDKENTLEPYYNALSQYASEKNIQLDTPQKIRDAVIEIRSSKLPDPSVVANNGSFFANPIVDSYKLSELQETYPSIPHWDVGGDSHKISAAWLIEQAGFKDFTDAETGMATWPKQPLVLVNENAKSTADLLVFRSKLVSAVQEKFGIELTQEPELLPIQ